MFINEVNPIMPEVLEAKLDTIASLFDAKLDPIENLLKKLVSQKAVKEYYSTAEVAERVKRCEYQVREWCRTGRIQAVKRKSGRGRSKEWMISHEELVRYESQGLREV
jgi:Helix-turn-helix domain